MSIKTDVPGRRSVAVETEVPGTIDEVWAAIASGPGVTSWFVPTEVDGRVGGQYVCHFGPSFSSAATITEWEAPHRFQKIGPETGHGPAMGVEWIVEAKDGGTCVVRVVNSLFTDSEEWDDQLTGFESGWPGFFRILGLYLRHFRGLPASSFLAMAMAAGPPAEVWPALKEKLGLAGAQLGEERQAAAGVPDFAGRVEHLGEGKSPNNMLLRLGQPGPGLASFGAFPAGEKARIGFTFYFYGEGAAAIVAAAEPAWNDWLGNFTVD